jgi:hypothetical protein
MNYKVGWVIPSQVLGLTHFHPIVTPEDIAGATETAEKLIEAISRRFHIIIDNRIVKMESLTTLQQLKQAAPFLANYNLREVVMVVPLDTQTLPEAQSDGYINLTYVRSIEEAIEHLDDLDDFLDVADMDARFFPEHT